MRIVTSAVTVVCSSLQRRAILLIVVCGSEKVRILGTGGRGVMAEMRGHLQVWHEWKLGDLDYGLIQNVGRMTDEVVKSI